MKKRNYLLLFSILVLLVSVTLRAQAENLGKHWANKVIEDFLSKGYIRGYQDGSFLPDNSITRAEFVSIVNKVMNFEEKSNVTFTDVKSDDWFADDVKIAHAAGYIEGYKDGSFKPNGNLTRAEAAVIVSRINRLKNSETDISISFSDSASIPSWAKEAINMVVKSGHIKGYPDGSFQAANMITRAEAFTILSRIDSVQLYSDPDNLIIEDDQAVVEKKLVKKNLIVSEKLGEGTATLKDLTIEGDLLIRGGGMHSVYLENVTVKGKTVVEKNNVRVQLVKKTSIPRLEIKMPSLISSDKFSGKLQTVTVLANSDNFKEGEQVNIKAKADSLNIETKSKVLVQENIKNVKIEKKAEGTSLELSKNTTISDLKSDGKARISGQGRVEKISSPVSNLSIDQSVKRGPIAVPPSSDKTPSGSGSGGSSSTPDYEPNAPDVSAIELTATPSDIAEDDASISIAVKFTPAEAKNKNVIWKLTKGADKVKILSSNANSAQLLALDNGDYTIEAVLASNSSIHAKVSGTISGQIVKIEDNRLNLIPGDREISGVEAGKSYVLQANGTYISVDSFGMAIDEFHSLEQAKLYSAKLKNGYNKITALKNENSYRVILFDSSDLFEKKLEAFLAINKDSMTAQNFEQIQVLLGELAETILENLAKYPDPSSPENKKWQGYQAQHKKKRDELKEKFDEIVQKVETDKNTIKRLISEIKKKNSTLNEVKIKMEEIDRLYPLLSKKAQLELQNSEMKSYQHIQKEIRLFEELNKISISLNDRGVVTLSEPASVKLEVLLYRDNGQSGKIDLPKGSVSINLLQDLRKRGVGTYRAELNYDFEAFTDTLTSKTEDKKVQYLAELGTLTLEGENFTKTGQTNTDKVELNFEEGLLKWDSVEQAQFYDIVGEFTFVNTSLPMGKYYVHHKPEESGLQDFPDKIINNAEELKELPLGEYKGKKWPVFQDQQFSTSFIRIAANIENKNGIKSNSLKLSEFIPTMRNAASNAHEIQDGDGVVLDIYIIPRNLDGLFLTNTEGLKDRKTVYIDGIQYKRDFLEKFKF